MDSEACRSLQDIYARNLSCSRGYPLWKSDPDSSRGEDLEELRIGDVGVIAPEDGHFSVFFNICLPADQQPPGCDVPNGFSHIALSETAIETGEETRGRIIKSSFVERVDEDGSSVVGDTLPIENQSGKAEYKFKLSYEGAMLIFPEGAVRHDVKDLDPFFKLVSSNAATWYQFAKKQWDIGDDGLYVITGFHKAPSFASVAYENKETPDTCTFVVDTDEGASKAKRYSWNAPTVDTQVAVKVNQAVFVRGFKVALKSDRQGVPQRWVSEQPIRQSSGSLLANTLSSISKMFGVSKEEEVGVARVEISRIPQFLPVFHPSDVINRHILQEKTSVNVAITHDIIWTSLLNKPGPLLDDDLMKAICETYTPVFRDGPCPTSACNVPTLSVAYLQNKEGSNLLVDAITGDGDLLATKVAICTLEDKICDDDVSKLTANTGSLSVVKESNYRCVDDTAANLVTPESQSAGLQSFRSAIPSMDTTPGSKRLIKIIVVSDYVCAFCYICDKILHDAVNACHDLPVRFDVEYRPFTLVDGSVLPRDQLVWRNPYLLQRFGKEQADIKLTAVYELSQKVGLKLADDSIVSVTAKAHRLAAKAYEDGGQDLQRKFNTFIFDACLAKKANLGDETVLADAAVSTGLVRKQEEATAFLRSTEHQDSVEKMVEAARAQGINGVPFIIIDGKWAVNGLQPVECFIQIFRKIVSNASNVVRKTESHEGASS